MFNSHLRRPLHGIRKRQTFSYRPRYASSSDGHVLASISGGRESGTQQPPPEDAKGQAKVAFRSIGTVIKILVYSGVGLGITAAVGFVGLHLWVEHIELPPANRGPGITADSYAWNEEVSGWSAGFMGKGTDPRIGWRARSLIRAAWVAENWQTGRAGLGPQERQDTSDDRLVDSAYAISETRLQEAIFIAKEAGLQPNDRTLIELQNRLAEVCQRIDTSLSLFKAYEIYAQVWRSCLASTKRRGDGGLNHWELHEALRAARRLGELGLKLAAFERPTDVDRAMLHQQTSEKYLIWAITHGLETAIKSSHQRSVADSSPTKPLLQHHQAESSSTWWGWLWNSNQKTKTSSGLTSRSIKADVKQIENKLKEFSQNSSESGGHWATFSPVITRLTISSLFQLSTHLVTIDLSTAHNFQTLIHDFLHAAKQYADSKAKESPDAQLQHLWLRSRSALSSVYLSELRQAGGTTKDQLVIDQCLQALQEADSALLALDSLVGESFKLGSTRHTSGRLAEQSSLLKRDLRLTAAMASNFLGMKSASCPNDPNFKNRPDWCGLKPGCQAAKEFFQRALKYSAGSSQTNDEKLIQPWKEASQQLAKIEA
ncbi:hypothetical protein O181_052379 [Austropuccinia psidii MF-1]|uniref:Uncharacterized protein n=1 Tax=Austropuccinia psidii MF-1 TaxID=1389203 RepID=A0A9Q3HRL5_9BASI|nr:hypothetical protein [Austropuccinia psidii MF-1]